MKFAGMKIGQRLTVGFGMVIALMLAVTVIGISRISQIDNGIDNMVNDFYPKTVMANTIKDELNEITRSMRNLLFMSTVADIKKELSIIEKSGNAITETLTKFEKIVNSEEGRRLIKDVRDAREKYQPLLANYVKLVTDGQVEQAKDLALPEIGPHQQKYFESLNKLIAFQGDLMDRAGKRAASTAGSTRMLMIMLALTAAVLAVLAGIWTTLARCTRRSWWRSASRTAI